MTNEEQMPKVRIIIAGLMSIIVRALKPLLVVHFGLV